MSGLAHCTCDEILLDPYRNERAAMIMARRRNKHARPARPLGDHHPHAEEKRDGRWIVRSVSGAKAVKEYRCPGCDQPIRPATPHVVAWPADAGWQSDSGLEDRRHWHTGCWQRRQ